MDVSTLHRTNTRITIRGVAMTSADRDHNRPVWFKIANCRGLDTNLFYPGRGEPTSEPKAVCRHCDVQTECLTYAINTGERLGVWGGLTAKERRRLPSCLERQPKAGAS